MCLLIGDHPGSMFENKQLFETTDLFPYVFRSPNSGTCKMANYDSYEIVDIQDKSNR